MKKTLKDFIYYRMCMKKCLEKYKRKKLTKKDVYHGTKICVWSKM